MSVDGRVLRRALDTLGDVIYIYDDTERLVYWNRRLNELYGLTDAELDGMPATEFFGPTERPTIEAAIEEIHETGETVVEAWSPTVEGPVRFELTGRLLTDNDGEVFGFAGIGRDVTERYEQTGQLSQQNERLAEFADLLAHDLRNPLSVASGHLALAREEGADSLDAVQAAHERIERIITDIRLATREGVVATDPEPTDVTQVAREAWEYVDTDGASFDAPEALVLDADADRLLRLFENLFRNAVEHGSTGNRNAVRSDDAVEHSSTSNRTQSDDAIEHGRTGGASTVQVRLEATDGGFAVEDDGPGIDPAVRDRIFDPGVSGAAGGTGFGLYIVRTIAAAHGWEVSVTDAADGGARFEFGVP